MPVAAEGDIYVDGGIGTGFIWTKVNGYEAKYRMLLVSGGSLGFGFEGGFRAGYGPMGTTPLYIVGDVDVMSNGLFGKQDTVFFNSILVGPGVIYYPIYNVQVGASFGGAFDLMMGTLPILEDGVGFGLGWNIMAGFDFGEGYHGFLLGIKYTGAVVGLRGDPAKQVQNMIGIFIRYAYREKSVWWR
jgi:hypothetical protein